MKKFNNYISLGIFALVGFCGLIACDDSKDNDFVQEYDGPAGVYFSNSANAYLELSEDASTITYPVYRDEAGAELTVSVEVSPVANYSVKDIYTFPSTVTFAAGSKVADFVISYDISKAEMGVEQQYELTLDAESNPFSSNNVVITLVNPAPWILLGTNGQYYDYGWGISADSTGPATVSVWQQGLDPNLYRISNPYIALNGIENSYFEFRVLQEGDVFYGVTVNEEDLVGYSLYYINYDPDDNDDIYVAFPGLFTNDISLWTNNRVLEYQDNGLPGLVQMAPVYFLYNLESGYNYPALDPYIYINFPNHVSLDTSLEVTYEGILTPSSMVQQVLLSVELGSDITSARAAVAPGKDVNSIANAIENGQLDYTEFNASGNVKINFGNNNETGDYTAVVLAYIGDEVKSVESVSFFYISSTSDYDPNEGWTSLGYVDYTDGYVCANIFLETPITTYSVEIQENDETPGYYRLVNPYGEPYPYNTEGDYNAYIDSYLYIHAEDPNRVYITQSTQTLDWGEYGALNYCWSMADYFKVNGSDGQPVTDDQIAAAGYFGTYADGKIRFDGANFVDGVLYSTLAAYWSYIDTPQYDGLIYSNAALDYDQFINSGQTEPYMYNDDGTILTPFCVDMSSLTKEANYRLDGHVMLTTKATMPPRPTSLIMGKKVYKPVLPISEKSTGKLLKKDLVKLERAKN